MKGGNNMENIKTNGFVELSSLEMYDVDGGVAWLLIAGIAGCVVCFGAGIYDGYKGR